MADINSLAEALTRKRIEDARRANPFIGAGTGILNAPLIQPTKKSDIGKAFLASALQGLVGGGLNAFGERQVQQEVQPFRSAVSNVISGQAPVSSLSQFPEASPLIDAFFNQRAAEQERARRLALESFKGIRTIDIGDKKVTQQINPFTGEISNIAVAPRNTGGEDVGAIDPVEEQVFEKATRLGIGSLGKNELQIFNSLSNAKKKELFRLSSSRRANEKLEIDRELAKKAVEDEIRDRTIDGFIVIGDPLKIPKSAKKTAIEENATSNKLTALFDDFILNAPENTTLSDFFGNNPQKLGALSGQIALELRKILKTGARLEGFEAAAILSNVPQSITNPIDFFNALTRTLRGVDEKRFAVQMKALINGLNARRIFDLTSQVPPDAPLGLIKDSEFRNFGKDRIEIIRSAGRVPRRSDFPKDQLITRKFPNGKIVTFASDDQGNLILDSSGAPIQVFED